jgi:hypothetical protein
LREAGLGSLPGGGAEIFDDRVHDEAYKNKVGEKGWFDVHRTAHEMGIFSNARSFPMTATSQICPARPDWTICGRWRWPA